MCTSSYPEITLGPYGVRCSVYSNHPSARRETACSQASIVACFKEKSSESRQPQASLHFEIMPSNSGNSAATVLRSLLSSFRLCPDFGQVNGALFSFNFQGVVPSNTILSRMPYRFSRSPIEPNSSTPASRNLRALSPRPKLMRCGGVKPSTQSPLFNVPTGNRGRSDCEHDPHQLTNRPIIRVRCLLSALDRT